MVGTIKKWIQKWLDVDVLSAKVKILENAPESTSSKNQYLEARIAFLESLPKPEKTAPKPHKTTFRQFAAAASQATEEEE